MEPTSPNANSYVISSLISAASPILHRKIASVKSFLSKHITEVAVAAIGIPATYMSRKKIYASLPQQVQESLTQFKNDSISFAQSVDVYLWGEESLTRLRIKEKERLDQIQSEYEAVQESTQATLKWINETTKASESGEKASQEKNKARWDEHSAWVKAMREGSERFKRKRKIKLKETHEKWEAERISREDAYIRSQQPPPPPPLIDWNCKSIYLDNGLTSLSTIDQIANSDVNPRCCWHAKMMLTSDQSQVDAVWSNFKKIFHPDKYPEALKEIATVAFQKLGEAYQVLSYTGEGGCWPQLTG